MEIETQVVGGGGGGGEVVESGYSSMVSSQREGQNQNQNQSQGRHMLGEEQLREFAGEGERSGYPSLLTGTQGGRVGDGVAGINGGVGGDPVRGGSSPVLSRFAPPSPPPPPPPPPPHAHLQRTTPAAQSQAQVHPAPGATDGLPPLPEKIEEVIPCISSPPSTPPKTHVSMHQQNSNNIVSASTSVSGSPPPSVVAGAKRTSSGKVKAITVGVLGLEAASVPGSPMEVLVSPTEASVEVGTVDRKSVV